MGFTIREIEAQSGVLGRFPEIKFLDEEHEQIFVDRIFYRLADINASIGLLEFFDKLKSAKAVYKIRIVETLIIGNEEKVLFMP